MHKNFYKKMECVFIFETFCVFNLKFLRKTLHVHKFFLGIRKFIEHLFLPEKFRRKFACRESAILHFWPNTSHKMLLGMVAFETSYSKIKQLLFARTSLINDYISINFQAFPFCSMTAFDGYFKNTEKIPTLLKFDVHRLP